MSDKQQEYDSNDELEQAPFQRQPVRTTRLLPNLRWSPSSRTKYWLAEAMSLLLLIPTWILIVFSIESFSWYQRVLVWAALGACSIVAQAAVDSPFKPKWVLFFSFCFFSVTLAGHLAYPIDRPAVLRPETVSAAWLELAVVILMIPAISFAAEDIFRVVKTWMAWRYVPALPFEIVSVCVLLIILHQSGYAYPGIPNLSLSRLVVGGVLLVLTLAALWLLPLRWMPRTILLGLILISTGLLSLFVFFIMPLLWMLFDRLIDDSDERLRTLHETWAHRKGISVASDGEGSISPPV